MSGIFKETCRLLCIQQLNATAYHHQTLGALENSHKHLGAYLRIQASENWDTWGSWVPYWCFAYNNTVHTETRYTPYELVFGKIAQLPSNVTTKVDPIYNFDDYPKELKYRLQVAWDDARYNLIQSKSRRKEKCDLVRAEFSFKEGDKVLMRNPLSDKSDAVYKGPYEVISDEGSNAIVKVKDKPVRIHKDRLKLYRS